MFNKSHDFNNTFQNAIIFLVDRIHNQGNNPKPVIVHSLRVAFYLDNLNYSTNIVIAGLLHDVVEDSNTTINQIEAEFGQDIAQIVAANTFNRNIDDKTEIDKDMLNRCVGIGKDALIVKGIDLLDNSYYFHLAKDTDTYKGLVKKLEYFLGISESFIKEEKIFKDLTKRYDELLKQQK